MLQAERDTGESQAGTSFGRYSAALRRLSERQRLHEITEQVCRDGDQLLMHLALSLPDAESNPQLKNCRDWKVAERRKAEAMVNNATSTCTCTCTLSNYMHSHYLTCEMYSLEQGD